MKKFKVTFEKGKDKYRKTERTIQVDANSKSHAEDLIYRQFGSFTIREVDNGQGIMVKMDVPSKKIIITKTEEIIQEALIEGMENLIELEALVID